MKMLKKINGSFRDFQNQVYEFDNIIIRRIIEEKGPEKIEVNKPIAKKAKKKTTKPFKKIRNEFIK